MKENPVSFKSLDYREPALWRGVATALIALLGAVGVTVSSDLSGLVESLIVTASLALPLIQAVTTRAAVVSPATADDEIKTAQALASGLAQADLRTGPRDGGPQTPGVADHAAQE